MLSSFKHSIALLKTSVINFFSFSVVKSKPPCLWISKALFSTSFFEKLFHGGKMIWAHHAPWCTLLCYKFTPPNLKTIRGKNEFSWQYLISFFIFDGPEVPAPRKFRLFLESPFAISPAFRKTFIAFSNSLSLNSRLSLTIRWRPSPPHGKI